MREYDDYRAINPSSIFFVLIAMVGAGLILGLMAGWGLWIGMTGKDLMSLPGNILNPQYANFARIFQMLVTFFMFFVPAVVAAKLITRHSFRFLGYWEGVNWRQILLVLGLVVVCFPLSGSLADLTSHIPLPHNWSVYFQQQEDEYNKQAQALLKISSPAEFLFAMVVMALLPAVFEETLFRGALQQILIDWFKRPILGIVVASVIFSVVHLSYEGFLSRFALGMVLGLMFYYSRSIWLNIAAHFLNNAVAVTAMYYYSQQHKPLKDITEDNIPFLVGIPALIGVWFLMKYLAKVSRERLISKIPPMDAPSTTSNLA